MHSLMRIGWAFVVGVLLAAVAAAAVVSLARAAPSPASGTISPSTPALDYTSGPLTGQNPSGTAGTDPVCLPGTCDDYALNVAIPASYRDANPDDIVTIRVSWPNNSNDFDLYLVGGDGSSLSSSATGNDPEVIQIPIGALPDGPYIVRVVLYDVTNETYAAHLTLNAAPPPPPPAAGTQTAIYVAGTDLFSCNQHLTGQSPVSNHDGDSEPGVKIDKDGKAYVGGLAGVPTGGIGLWRVTDPCGQDFQFLPIPDGSLGGGDVDIEIAPVKNGNGFYNIYTSSLTLPNVTQSVSMDGGATFLPVPISNYTPVNDRQWNACYGPSTVYLSFRTLNLGNQLIVYRSDNAGLPGTFLGPFSVYTDVITDTNPLNAQLGNMVADQRPGADFSNPLLPHAAPNGAGNVYHGFMTNTTDQNRIYVGVSKDFGVTWTSKLVFQGGVGTSFRYDFCWVAVDQAGNVYTAFSDMHNIYYAVSSDQGDHWSAPFRVSNGADNKAAVFPSMDAGSAGRVVLTWYGTSSAIGVTNPIAKYHVFHARCDNALAPLTGGLPVFEQVRVTDHVMHTGQICLNGTACTSGRELAEDFEIGVDPSDGSSFITYTDNGAEGGTYIAREIAGPSAIAGKVVVDRSNECPRNTGDCRITAIGNPCTPPGVRMSTDDIGDAAPPDDQRDIEWIAVAEPFGMGAGQDRLVFTMKVRSLNPALLPTPAAWRMHWSFSGTQYYVRMLSCPSGVTYDYGTVGTTSTSIGPADGGTYSPDGTISISMPKSHVGNPGPGDVLAAVSGETRVHAGPCPAIPGPAGAGQNVDDIGGASYTLTPAAYCGPTATMLQRFDARNDEGDVELTWQADLGGDVTGFNLYRGRTAGEALERVNESPILASGPGVFTYRDHPATGGTIVYRLAATLSDGGEVSLGTTSVILGGESQTLSLALAGANPFHGATGLRYTVPRRTSVDVSVYSVSGQRVATLVRRVEEPGVHTIAFDLQRSAGRSLGAGIYLVRLTAGGEQRSVRLIGLE